MTRNERKIYITDTNVLVHDPESLNHFDEHDVVVPIPVLEEMDRIKRGTDEIARNVRDVIRKFDMLSEGIEDLEDGCPLPGGGMLMFPIIGVETLDVLPESLNRDGGDNRILAATLQMMSDNPNREVILVTKDINLRIKGRALGIKVEDYRHDKVVSDLNILPRGWCKLDADLWEKICENSVAEDLNDGDEYHVCWPEEEAESEPDINSFVVLTNNNGNETHLQCIKKEEGKITLANATSYRCTRNAIWSIQARNSEQNMAMNLLMNADIDIVTVMGLAGSGKTMLALACGLHQTLDMGLYDKILVTRATVPMGQDIGFLPGTEKEKMGPWMGAITDNLQILCDGENMEYLLEQSRIEITSLSFARGRTFSKTWVIVDEAQNLTPHQMKTLVTRMGEDSKLVILGNNSQIDTPYLSPRTNGLTQAAMAFKGWKHNGIVTLQDSERSRLAAKATEVL